MGVCISSEKTNGVLLSSPRVMQRGEARREREERGDNTEEERRGEQSKGSREKKKENDTCKAGPEGNGKG